MSEQSTARTATGTVVSNSMEKSIVVLVDRKIRDAKYGKYIRRTTKMHAHDGENQCNVGDTVIIQECRPLSKTKTWNLVKVLVKAK